MVLCSVMCKRPTGSVPMELLLQIKSVCILLVPFPLYGAMCWEAPNWPPTVVSLSVSGVSFCQWCLFLSVVSLSVSGVSFCLVVSLSV